MAAASSAFAKLTCPFDVLAAALPAFALPAPMLRWLLAPLPLLPAPLPLPLQPVQGSAYVAGPFAVALLPLLPGVPAPLLRCLLGPLLVLPVPLPLLVAAHFACVACCFVVLPAGPSAFAACFSVA